MLSGTGSQTPSSTVSASQTASVTGLGPIVCDADTGETVRSGSAPHPGGTEVDPREWWAALDTAIGVIEGLGRDDRLVGGTGDDVLDGGAGIDTASYEGALGPVVAALQRFLRGEAKEVEITAKPPKPVPFGDVPAAMLGGPAEAQRLLGLGAVAK
jgi:hypothetical protein